MSSFFNKAEDEDTERVRLFLRLANNNKKNLACELWDFPTVYYNFVEQHLS